MVFTYQMTKNAIFDAITILNKRFYFIYIKAVKIYNIAPHAIQ